MSLVVFVGVCSFGFCQEIKNRWYLGTDFAYVSPEDADPDQDKISILAPIGTALLGYKVGDIIEWKVPAGIVKLKVEEILYQPEAAVDYHL